MMIGWSRRRQVRGNFGDVRATIPHSRTVIALVVVLVTSLSVLAVLIITSLLDLPWVRSQGTFDCDDIYLLPKVLGGRPIAAGMARPIGTHVGRQWKACGTWFPIEGTNSMHLMVLYAPRPEPWQPSMQVQLVGSTDYWGTTWPKAGSDEIMCNFTREEATIIIERGALPDSLVDAIVQVSLQVGWEPVPGPGNEASQVFLTGSDFLGR